MAWMKEKKAKDSEREREGDTRKDRNCSMWYSCAFTKQQQKDNTKTNSIRFLFYKEAIVKHRRYSLSIHLSHSLLSLGTDIFVVCINVMLSKGAQIHIYTLIHSYLNGAVCIKCTMKKKEAIQKFGLLFYSQIWLFFFLYSYHIVNHLRFIFTAAALLLRLSFF